jgi:IclR family KDG regulon transcriptional repressor
MVTQMANGTEFHDTEPAGGTVTRPVTAVVRAAAILRAFSHERPTLHFSQIVDAVGLPKSTTHRLLLTLIDVGFVEQRQDGTYALGIGLFEVGSLAYANVSLRAIAQPFVRRLMDETKETVHLGVLDGFEVVSLEQASSPHSLRAEVYVGKRAPLHCTAVGKAILAFVATSPWLHQFWADSFEQFTTATITDPAGLRSELDDIRKRGYAIDNEEHEVGVRCVGAPIRDASGAVVGSLSISGPSARVTPESITELARRLLRATGQISAALGYAKAGRPS